MLNDYAFGYGFGLAFDAKGFPGPNERINRSGVTPKSFWSYKASSETPSLEEAIKIGAISSNTTQEQWQQLSPGMRREIVRSKKITNDSAVNVKRESIGDDGSYSALIVVYGFEFSINYINNEIRVYGTNSRAGTRGWKLDSAAKAAKSWAAERIKGLGRGFQEKHERLYSE